MRRYKDWLKQAKADLEVARDSLKAKHYEWACFQAQQGAEKAAKALAEKKGRKKFRHPISYILSGPAPKGLVSLAKTLDRYYIPTRYPNSFDYDTHELF
jgi:HEPN domain-containing protein